MTVKNACRFVVGAIASVALLGGCSAGSPGAIPQGLAQRMLADPRAIASARSQVPVIKPGRFVYTAQFYEHDLDVYSRAGLSLKFKEALTKGVAGPLGTVTTPDGWWYVANSGHSDVLVYRTTKHGPKGPGDSLDDYGQLPVNVSTTPNRRLVAVSNGSMYTGGPGSVSVYLDRQVEPSRILTYGTGLVQGEGIAIDHQGNCYWSFNDPLRGGSIVEFTNCEGAGSAVLDSISNAGGLAFDQSDNLYYVDQTVGVYKCKKHASQCALLVPVGPGQLGRPLNLNFDHKSKYLWVADLTGYIDAVDPKRGTIVYQTPAVGGPTDPPFGIAPAPGS